MIALRHRLEYALLLTLRSVVRATPFSCQKRLGDLMKWLVKKLDKRRFRQVRENLELAFPNLEAAERDALREQIYRHFSRVIAEWLYMFAHHRRPPGSKPVELVNTEHLQTVLDLGKGAIFVSAHFGNWELIPYILKDRLPTPLIAIARPMNNPLVEKLVSKFRKFMGSQIIYKKGALRKILRHIDDNRLIYLLIDQNAVPREAVFVNFFSQKVSAISSAAQIHLKKGAPLLPLFLRYEPQRIVLEFLPPILPPQEGRTAESLTQEMTRAIEEQIRKHPDQWFWFHNRWKTRPSGAAT